MPQMPRLPGGRIAAAAALLLGSVLIAGPAPAALAAPPACSVTDDQSAATFGNVASAVGAATPGDTLKLAGPCAGGVSIDKNLKIVGVLTAGRPTITGGGGQRPVIVLAGVTVTMSGLVIRDGNANGGDGGGVNNAGTLTLIDVVVRDSVAQQGGGIANTGTLTLKGSSSVHDNSAVTYGGGIYSVFGVLTVGGSTEIQDNDADVGGGLDLIGGTTVIGGTSRIFRNAASVGGGMSLYGGTVTLKESVLVDANLGAVGSGIYTIGTATNSAPHLVMLDHATVGRNDLGNGYGSAVTLVAFHGAASLVMNGSATVRGQYSPTHPQSAAVLLISYGPAASLTMKGTSTITKNQLGPGWGAVVRWNCPGAGATTSVVGATSARVSNNTPRNLKIDTTTACPT